MHRFARRSGLRIGALLGAGALALGTPACGDEAPESRLEQASEQLTEAREDAHDARERLAEARAREEEASEALQQARSGLRQAEREVLSARELVDQRASDVAIFRAVQAATLDAPALRDAAVEVRVDDRVVTLTGLVQDDEARQRAIEIARETAGVRDVRDRLDVEHESADAEAAAEPAPTPSPDRS